VSFDRSPGERLDADGPVLNADGEPLVVRSYTAGEDRW
jgi:hypothetical protein